MAVVNISGLQGSGKSYYCVQSVVIPACRIGRTIVTNIPLRDDLLKADFPKTDIQQFDIEDWVKNPELVDELPGGSVVIIDEAWRLFPGGQKTNNAPKPLKALIAEHRHRSGEVAGDTYSMEIVTITQDMQVDLAAYLRAKTDRTIVCTKLSVLGSDTRFVADVYARAVSAEKPKKNQHVRKIGPLKYLPEVYQYYQSQTQAENDEHGSEKAQSASVVIWKKPLFWFWTPLVFIAGFYALSWLWGFFHGNALKPAQAAQVETRPAPKFVPVGEIQQQPIPVAPPAPSPAPPPARPPDGSPKPEPVPVQSSRWRVAGRIDGPAGGQVVLYDGDYTRVLPAADCEASRYGETVCRIDGELVTHYSGRVRSVVPAPVPDLARLVGVETKPADKPQASGGGS